MGTWGVGDAGEATHRQDEVVLDLLQVAQRENEALGVALALTDQEETARGDGKVTQDPWQQSRPWLSLTCAPMAPPDPSPILTRPPGPAA